MGSFTLRIYDFRSKQIATHSGCNADHAKLFTSTYALYANSGSIFRCIPTGCYSPGLIPIGPCDNVETSQINAMQSSATVQIRLDDTGDHATAFTHPLWHPRMDAGWAGKRRSRMWT